MCVDTRFVNAHLPTPQFKNETIDIIAPMLIEENCLMISTDISKAYYCIPIHESMQPYLCFEHAGLVICPQILVFGLNEAPFYFNKIIRQMVKFCRSIGLRMTSYFDDQLWIATAQEDATTLVKLVKLIMNNLGWQLNEKAILTPSTSAEHIGYEIRSNSMTIHRSTKKVTDLVELLKSYTSKKSLSLANLTSVAGKISATRQAIPIVGSMTREIYKTIAKSTQRSWNMEKQVNLNEECMDELIFWRDNLHELNEKGSPIRHPATSTVIETDASDTGWGASIVKGSDSSQIAGQLSELDAIQSSTYREILAIKMAITHVANDSKAQTLKIRTDNQAAEKIINRRYSKSDKINRLSREIGTICDRNGIHLIAEWIPRSENKLADLLSRLATQIPEKMKEQIKMTLSLYKKEVESFSFKNENSSPNKYLVFKPDPNFIPAAIAMMKKYNLRSAIIHPNWQAQSWWPWLRSNTQMISISKTETLSIYN
jgi:ribonuclease HI